MSVIQTTIPPENRPLIKRACGHKGQIITATLAKLYKDRDGRDAWTDLQIQGALVFMRNVDGMAEFSFRIIDVKQERILWELDLVGSYAMDCDFFHVVYSDKGEKYGLSFMDVGEAVQFFDIVQKKREAASQVVEPVRQASITKDMISGPRHFKHVSHVGFDARDGRVIVDNVSRDMAQLLQQQRQDKVASSIAAGAFRSPPTSSSSRFPEPPQQPVFPKHSTSKELESVVNAPAPPRPSDYRDVPAKEPLFNAVPLRSSEAPITRNSVSHSTSKSLDSSNGKKVPPPPPPRRTKITEPSHAAIREKDMPIVPPRPDFPSFSGSSKGVGSSDAVEKPVIATVPRPVAPDPSLKQKEEAHKISNSMPKVSSNAAKMEDHREEHSWPAPMQAPGPRTAAIKESHVSMPPKRTEEKEKVPAVSPAVMLPIVPPPQKTKDNVAVLPIIPPPPPPSKAKKEPLVVKETTRETFQKVEKEANYTDSMKDSIKAEIQAKSDTTRLSPMADSFEELSLQPASSSGKLSALSSSNKQIESSSSSKQTGWSGLQAELDRKMAIDREASIEGEKVEMHRKVPIDRAIMPISKKEDIKRQQEAVEPVSFVLQKLPLNQCSPPPPPPPPNAKQDNLAVKVKKENVARDLSESGSIQSKVTAPVPPPPPPPAASEPKATHKPTVVAPIEPSSGKTLAGVPPPPPPPPPTKSCIENSPKLTPASPLSTKSTSPSGGISRPPQVDGRSQLMEAIRQGAQLKKRPTEEKDALKELENVPAPKNAFQQMLLSAMASTNLSPAAAKKNKEGTQS